jgi:hypothetical protein
VRVSLPAEVVPNSEPEYRNRYSRCADDGKRCARLWTPLSGFAAGGYEHYEEADRREVPPIQVEMATWSPGGQLDWWVKENRPRVEWWGRVRVPTVGVGGSKLVIFVLRADHSHESSRSFLIARRPCWLAKPTTAR